MPSTTTTASTHGTAAPVFHHVLCGIDASPPDAETVRQAAILAGPDAHLELLSVVYEAGAGMSAQVQLSQNRARRALRLAHDIAVDAGARPSERTVIARSDSETLLAEAEGHDLLVVGDHGKGRVAGMLLGSTASYAVHRAPCPVLIARGGSQPPEFPGLVLLADDGTGTSVEAASLAAAVAGRHGCDVVLAAPGDSGREGRRALAEHAAAVTEATGREPVLLDVDGPPHRAIPLLAREVGASLVVLGSRGLRGLRALTSVSERVASHVGCSVLVVRNPVN